MEETKYTYRFLARVIIEAVTPLSVASGKGSVMTDSEVVMDSNGLPYIPGTSIAGVVRHTLGEEIAKSFFGKHDSANANDNMGSEIIFSECRMVGKDGKVIDGMNIIDFSDPFYGYFQEMPIRQHVRMNHKGVSMDGGKFDEQVFFAGTRFCFEVELLSSGPEREKEFVSVLDILRSRSFRLGGKTRRGFGKIRIVSLQTASLDLRKEKDLKDYLDKSSFLDSSWSRWDKNTISIDPVEDSVYEEYELRLKPADFFSFGSGSGDDEVDMSPVLATVIEWGNQGAEFKQNRILIPGTSVKGALAHRVAWYYNQMCGVFADKLSANEFQEMVSSMNPAVKELFGYEGVKKDKSTLEQLPGNIMISDLIIDREPEMKILNHVAIDRFTGGAMEGALFSEKTVCDLDSGEAYDYRIEILVKKKTYSSFVKEALEKALRDICDGMLPLGGGVNRGNGCFYGKLYKNGEEIWK